MQVGGLTFADVFVLVRHELMLFAGIFFFLGALDEWAVDVAYVWLRLTGRCRTPRISDTSLEYEPVAGPCAVLIPAWYEERVIAATIGHILVSWPQTELRLYVGCYRNDPKTVAAAREAGGSDPRFRLLVHEVDGPTCKADCLNRLYRRLCEDEARDGSRFRMVILHDAEDMVDPAGLRFLDKSLETADFAQLPVVALPKPGSPLVAGHYADEFADAHARTLVVRSALGLGVPGAGVGTAISRAWLDRLDDARGGVGPFAIGALTEDYELGLRLTQMGARSRFVRVRATDGRLVATRAYFPDSISSAVRQKTRWLHGIAFQGWDQLGWQGPSASVWMQMRDRRGPLAALLLAIAYILVLMEGAALVMRSFGLLPSVELPEDIRLLLWVNLVALIWRLGARSLFTTREHGLAQGILAIPRVLVSNMIAIVAARRAISQYIAALRSGQAAAWDKTDHHDHPALTAHADAGQAK